MSEKKKEEYAEFLNYELYQKDHIDFHAFMELFKERFGDYLDFNEVATFNQRFIEDWYGEMYKYFPELRFI